MRWASAGAVLVGIALLVAQPAAAHPLGQPPVLFLRATEVGVTATWIIAPDDAEELALHLGLGPFRIQALHEHEAFRTYFIERLRVGSAGGRCDPRVLPVQTVPTGISFTAVFDCGGPPGEVIVRLGLLHDIDERYQTLLHATTPRGIARGLLTAVAPRARIDFSGETAPGEVEPLEPEREPSGLLARITATAQGHAGASPLALAVVLAFAVGALHALTPGHGKTLTVAYLVGSGGTMRQALGLSGVVAATHAVSVGALGAAAISADRVFLPSDVGPWLHVAAGALILTIAWTILRARPHTHDAPAGAGRLSFRRVAAIGVVGGMIPTPDAIAVILVAFSLERWTAGAALLAGFSAGLAAVVLGVAVLAVRGSSVLRRFGGGRLAARAPVVVAAIFVVMGAIVLANGVRQL